MIGLGSVYDYLAAMQGSWFDGEYYVVINLLLTLVVYLLILLLCMIPAVILVFLARKIMEMNRTKNS